MLYRTLRFTVDGDEIMIPITQIVKVRKGKFNEEPNAKDCLAIVFGPKNDVIYVYEPAEIERIWKLLALGIV